MLSPPPDLLYKAQPPSPSSSNKKGDTLRRTHQFPRFTGVLCLCIYMGLLDQLWDDTVAGPRPDYGLGKLRKYASFSPASSSSTAASGPAAAPSAADAAPAVTRSITILRPPDLSVPSPRSEPSSAPSSPAASVPDSPFGTATTPRGEAWKKLRRKAWMADGTDASPLSPGTPRSPTVYDWVVISSLDR